MARRSLWLSLVGACERAVWQLIRKRTERRYVEKGGDPERWPERTGQAEAEPSEGPVIWVHAVSMGEMTSALPLIDALLAARPDARVLLTTTTVSSASLAALRLPERAIHRFAPVDDPGAVGRFLNQWKPERAIFLESELWPSQIAALDRRRIPLAVVSARLTEESARRWGRVPGLARAVFGRITLLLAQDAATAERARALGARNVEVAGSLKSAAAPLPVDEAERTRLAARIGQRPVWIAASTHPGEEKRVAEAHAILQKTHPDSLLILAPRHAERGPELEQLLERWRPRLRSRGAAPVGDLYIADTYGELGLWFSLSRTVFLGGSLVEGIGGHNPLEPAAFACRILTGPHTANADPDIAALGPVVTRVHTPSQIAEAVAESIGPPRTDTTQTGPDADLARAIAGACLAL